MTIKNKTEGAADNDEEHQAQLVEAELELIEDEGDDRGGIDHDVSEQQQPHLPQQEQPAEEEEITVPPEIETGSESNTDRRRAFPRAFFCPLTHKIMREPVVHPEDYLTYEKSAILERDGGDSLIYYPNRAVQAYIEQELSRWPLLEEEDDNNMDGSMRGTLKRFNDSARSGWQKLMEKTPLPMDYYRSLPDAFYCPITCDLIFDPAIDPDGTTYERSAIIQWLLVNGVSPNTRNPLRIEQLYENKTLLSLLLEESEGDPETIHPALKRWREELATRPPRPPDPEMPAHPVGDTADGDNPHNQTTTGIPPQHLNPQYPTTQAEWEELRRRRRPMTFLTILATLMACAMFLFFPSYFIFFVFCACGLLWIRKSQIAEQQQMMQRERAATAQNYHQWQIQQQQQQQQQQQPL